MLNGRNVTALGFNSGFNVLSATNSIYIGNLGVDGDYGVIRIGQDGTNTDTYIAGIIHGNGGGLTNLNAADLTGILSLSNLNPAVLTNDNAGEVTIGNNLDLINGGAYLLDGSPALFVVPTVNPYYASYYGGGAGNTNSTGNSSVGFGVLALGSVMSGSANTAYGWQAGANITNGSGNTFIGYLAGLETTSGHNNVGSGSQALRDNTSGSYNVSAGDQSMAQNTIGSLNTVAGQSALYANTTGSNNVALGPLALLYITNGQFNIGIGRDAGTNLPDNATNVIIIGNVGTPLDTNIIRIGNLQSDAYIAGIIHGNGSGLTNVPGIGSATNAINNNNGVGTNLTVYGTLTSTNLNALYDTNNAGIAAAQIATNNFGTTVPVNLTNTTNQFTGTFTNGSYYGNGSGLTNIPTGGISNFLGSITNQIGNTIAVTMTNANNQITGTFTNGSYYGSGSGLTNLQAGNVVGTLTNATTGSATAATNILGGLANYIVKTNGWYDPNGTWHPESNSGNSLQNALNKAAYYNPADAKILAVDYWTGVQIINLPYMVGGTFEISSGDYYSANGFSISNNLEPSSWHLIGAGAATRIIGDTNVIRPIEHYLANTAPCSLRIELENLCFLSKTNVPGVQVDLSFAAQDSYVHGCYFSMYDWWNNTNNMPFEDAKYITSPEGMIGLVIDGNMGNGTAFKNRFFGLACGIIASGESTYIEDNSFYSISQWQNGGSKLASNLWSNTNQVYVPDFAVPNSSYLQGAELSYGCALVLEIPQKGIVRNNFFFDGGNAIYVGKHTGKVFIEENFFQPIMPSQCVLFAQTNTVTAILSQNVYNAGDHPWPNITEGTINWDGATFPLTNAVVGVSPINYITDDIFEDASGNVNAIGFTGNGLGLTNIPISGVSNLLGDVTNVVNSLGNTVPANMTNAANQFTGNFQGQFQGNAYSVWGLSQSVVIVTNAGDSILNGTYVATNPPDNTLFTNENNGGYIEPGQVIIVTNPATGNWEMWDPAFFPILVYTNSTLIGAGWKDATGGTYNPPPTVSYGYGFNMVITNSVFTGNGSGLTNVPTSGISNFLGSITNQIGNTIAVTMTNANNRITGTFTNGTYYGNGFGLTNLNGTNLVGTLTNATTGNAATATTAGTATNSPLGPFGSAATNSASAFDTNNAGIAAALAATNAMGQSSGLAAFQNTNFFDLSGAGTAAALAATNNFGRTVVVNMTNTANSFTGNGGGLTNLTATNLVSAISTWSVASNTLALNNGDWFVSVSGNGAITNCSGAISGLKQTAFLTITNSSASSINFYWTAAGSATADSVSPLSVPAGKVGWFWVWSNGTTTNYYNNVSQ
jgi:hypothetical protein